MIYKGKEVPFKEADFECKCGCGKGYDDMSEELLDKLFEARRLAGVPFVISSAYRCEAHNKKVGGKPNSAHLRGCAVDIDYKGSRDLFFMLRALFQVNFRRIGHNEKQTFLHVDCDRTLPQEVFFKY